MDALVLALLLGLAAAMVVSLRAEIADLRSKNADLEVRLTQSERQCARLSRDNVQQSATLERLRSLFKRGRSKRRQLRQYCRELEALVKRYARDAGVSRATAPCTPPSRLCASTRSHPPLRATPSSTRAGERSGSPPGSTPISRTSVSASADSTRVPARRAGSSTARRSSSRLIGPTKT